MIDRINTTDGRRITPAENYRHATSGEILSVSLAPHEDVEWIYTYTPLGRIVSGYIIKSATYAHRNQKY